MGGRGWAGWSGVRGGKWDYCNSIINKYIKKEVYTEEFEFNVQTLYLNKPEF